MKTSFSPSFPAILAEAQATLAISTYQGGKVVLASSVNGSHLHQFAKSFPRPMGMAIHPEGSLAIACKQTVEVMAANRKLSLNFPKEPQKYDGIFFPRATYYTGPTDLHDMEWVGDDLIAVNTAFSCLCKITHANSFEPIWQPSFIDELMPEDRCHLNGLAMLDGQPKYVSMMCRTNEHQGWRKQPLDSGVIMDIEDESIIADQLPMPHSPRVIDGKLYFLLSAVGEIYVHDLSTGVTDLFQSTAGFARGMTHMGDYLFVGSSKIRPTSKSFRNLPISKRAEHACIEVFRISNGDKVAELVYGEKIEELFDLAILPGIRRGGILDKSGEWVNRAIVMDDKQCFWKKEQKQEEKAEVTNS
ncbi:TIGR03032 family protein [Pontibacter sp. G13]|uniref:TIGR03032 family protein n=1 Tax=Pontibacter sp. G13 TaxID=3074898 RepID=UPI0028894145|nr:TIGR03032 family protein [Pontibacter sp. G13]WNJ17355.1 TIGR03032 family protein [Pontibacter sp. G13]